MFLAQSLSTFLCALEEASENCGSSCVVCIDVARPCNMHRHLIFFFFPCPKIESSIRRKDIVASYMYLNWRFRRGYLMQNLIPFGRCQNLSSSCRYVGIHVIRLISLQAEKHFKLCQLHPDFHTSLWLQWQLCFYLFFLCAKWDCQATKQLSLSIAWLLCPMKLCLWIMPILQFFSALFSAKYWAEYYQNWSRKYQDDSFFFSVCTLFIYLFLFSGFPFLFFFFFYYVF